MNRRSLLAWLSGALSVACTSIIAIPGVRYLFATVSAEDSAPLPPQRVARLKDLPVGRPVDAAVTGQRRDAWSAYPEEVIGRVWLIRRTDAESPEEAQVDAFSGVCPHLRCAVQLDSSKGNFICPCHRGRFDLDGSRLSQNGSRNPANRGLDALPCLIKVDEDDQVWVEVAWQDFEPGIDAQVAMS